MKLLLILITALLALITFGFGGLWLGLGIQTIEVVGGETLPTGIGDAALAMADNTVRFLGGVWLATGGGLIICLCHLSGQRVMFRVIMGGLFIGGLGRLLSFTQLGVIDAFIPPTVIELILPPIALLLHALVYRHPT
jgi:hypothetical protein